MRWCLPAGGYGAYRWPGGGRCSSQPVPHCDVVTTTTHKTLRGPRGGLILCRDADFAKKFDKAVFPGSQGGPLEHVIAAKAVAFGEALQPAFKTYSQQVVANAAALAERLIARGIDVVSGGTDNHVVLLDLRSVGMTGKVADLLVSDVHITANKNGAVRSPIPFVTSGLRLGTVPDHQSLMQFPRGGGCHC